MRVALVTGAAGGLGTAIADVLLGDGYRVALVDVADPGEVTHALARVHGDDRVHAVRADITSVADVSAAVSAVTSRWDRVDALVNNAGVEPQHTADNVTSAMWDAVMAVNLRGPALLVKHCLPLWRAQGGGRIVSIGSRTWLGGGSTPSYMASKAGIVGMTRSFAQQLGAAGVTANVVAPSFVRTPLNEMKGGPEVVAEVARQFAAVSPLGRIIEPIDVAYAVAFLLSDRARNITGEVLHVSAGTQLAPVIG